MSQLLAPSIQPASGTADYHDSITCHDCGLQHRRRSLLPSQTARCVRCRAVLYRGGRLDAGGMAVVTLGALLIFLIAQCCPIVELSVGGDATGATLIGAVGVLWAQQMYLVAAAVFLFAVVLPAVELGVLLHITMALRGGRRPRGFAGLLRVMGAAQHWGMTAVLMLGILVAIVKLDSLAQVAARPGLFAFGVLTLITAVVASFDPQRLRQLAAQLPGPALPAAATRRYEDSVNRTWALLLAAAILYLPANLLPMMSTRTLIGEEGDTIISGVAYFWSSGSMGLAVIIFIASIAFPMTKLAALALLNLTVQRRSRWRPVQRTVLYRLVELLGRWSMLDIFVIALTAALVRFESLAVVTAGPGAPAFCAVVVLTMLASMQFDPHLIWNSPYGHGGQHV